MMYSTVTLLAVLATATAKLNELEVNSPTFKIKPEGVNEGINKFFYAVNGLSKAEAAVEESKLEHLQLSTNFR